MLSVAPTASSSILDLAVVAWKPRTSLRCTKPRGLNFYIHSSFGELSQEGLGLSPVKAFFCSKPFFWQKNVHLDEMLKEENFNHFYIFQLIVVSK